MKLALMAGDTVPPAELRSLGFHAVQMFWGSGPDGAPHDPTPQAVDAVLAAGQMALAAMTLHVDLVGPAGLKPGDVERAVRCVEQTARLDGRFGDNATPLLIWHPSGYPEEAEVNDRAVFAGLVTALRQVCGAATQLGVQVAVEITRAGSIGSAEAFLRLQDHVGSAALKVCLDGANFIPDRTPLERAVRLLGPDTVIAHAKDSSFHDNGTVAAYGPVGSGRLDYPTYMQLLRDHTSAPYMVLEYYRSRADLLRARDLVQSGL